MNSYKYLNVRDIIVSRHMHVLKCLVHAQEFATIVFMCRFLYDGSESFTIHREVESLCNTSLSAFCKFSAKISLPTTNSEIRITTFHKNEEGNVMSFEQCLPGTSILLKSVKKNTTIFGPWVP